MRSEIAWTDLDPASGLDFGDGSLGLREKKGGGPSCPCSPMQWMADASDEHKRLCRDLEQLPIVDDEDRSPYSRPGRCRLVIMISRIVVLTQFIRSDKSNARFRMFRLVRYVNSGEGSGR